MANQLPEPGAVLRLLDELDYMEPGEFVLLHFEKAAAVLCPLDSDDVLELGLWDEDDGPHLRVTDIKNLAEFEDTGASLPVDWWTASLRSATSGAAR